MLERSEKALRLLCIALAAALLLAMGMKLFSRNPLSGLKIPALPTLSADAESGGSGKGTNNTPENAARKETNSLATGHINGVGTNLLAETASTQEVHSAHHSSTRKADTNVVVAADAPSADTNAMASLQHGTNAVTEAEAPVSGTNALAQAPAPGASTNLAHAKPAKGTNTNAHAEMAMSGPGPNNRPGAGKRGPDLPPPILARVDRVVDSELFGPVFHPMPAGLMGIAGNLAFLRAANGQTGAVKEGDELGGLKLLRIGINRVLVEEDGQKKELMIFQGLGGQSLLPN